MGMPFQFTHPGKGATIQVGHVRIISQVSIHAPWEGCDVSCIRSKGVRSAFQFTHPGKGATCKLVALLSRYVFQFTHPGKGATVELLHMVQDVEVSIHAPWEGCD